MGNVKHASEFIQRQCDLYRTPLPEKGEKETMTQMSNTDRICCGQRRRRKTTLLLTAGGSGPTQTKGHEEGNFHCEVGFPVEAC